MDRNTMREKWEGAIDIVEKWEVDPSNYFMTPEQVDMLKKEAKEHLALLDTLEAQERRIRHLERGVAAYQRGNKHLKAELQKKSEFLRATAKTLFSERRSQEDTAIRWVLDKDGFVPPRRS